MGDELMALGQAVAARRLDPRPVAIVDALGYPRWHPLWDGSPHLVAERRGDHQTVLNAPRARPYIDYEHSSRRRWIFQAFTPTPAELPFLAPDPRGRGALIVEPNIKGAASPNKHWGWHRWQALVAEHPDLPWAQVGPAGIARLDGVRHIETQSYQGACNVLAAARAAVLPEGGLHHAAAAVGCPAVVLFGAYVSPRSTGYAAHKNLAVDAPEAIGWRDPHAACVAAWTQISPGMVLGALEELLHGR